MLDAVFGVFQVICFLAVFCILFGDLLKERERMYVDDSADALFMAGEGGSGKGWWGGGGWSGWQKCSL